MLGKGVIIMGRVKKDMVNGKVENNVTNRKLINKMAGDLVFDVKIPKGKYNIFKSYKEDKMWHTAKVELLEGGRIQVELAFGEIKAGKVVVPKDVVFLATTGLVEEED